MTGYAFPDMLVDTIRLSMEGQRDKAHDLFDAHLPLIRYEHQQDVGLSKVTAGGSCSLAMAIENVEGLQRGMSQLTGKPSLC